MCLKGCVVNTINSTWYHVLFIGVGKSWKFHWDWKAAAQGLQDAMNAVERLESWILESWIIYKLQAL